MQNQKKTIIIFCFIIFPAKGFLFKIRLEDDVIRIWDGGPNFFFPSIKIISFFEFLFWNCDATVPFKQPDIHIKSLNSVTTSRFPHWFVFWKYLCVAKETKLITFVNARFFTFGKVYPPNLKSSLTECDSPLGTRLAILILSIKTAWV